MSDPSFARRNGVFRVEGSDIKQGQLIEVKFPGGWQPGHLEIRTNGRQPDRAYFVTGRGRRGHRVDPRTFGRSMAPPRPGNYSRRVRWRH